MILPRVIQASLPRDSRVPERLHQRQLSYRVRRTQSSIISFSEPQNEERASGPLAAKIPIDPALVYNQPVTTKPPVDPVPARKAHAAVLPSKVSVDLSQVFNKAGIYTEGTPTLVLIAWVAPFLRKRWVAPQCGTAQHSRSVRLIRRTP
jgi:hypothetical protein